MSSKNNWYISIYTILGLISILVLYYNPIYSLLLMTSLFVMLISLITNEKTVYIIIYTLLIIMALFQTTLISYFIVLFAAMIYYLRIPKKNSELLQENNSRWMYFFFIWILFSFLQIIFLEITESTLRHFNALILGVCIIWLMKKTISSFKKLEVFYNLWGYLLLVVILLGWYEILTGNNIKEIVAYPDHYAATAGFYNKNDYSFMLGMSLPIVLYWFEGRLINKILALFMMISSLHHVFMNGTRSVLLLIIFSLLFYGVLLLYRQKVKSILFLMMIIVMLGTIFNKFLLSMIDKILTLQNDDSSINIRKRLYESGLEVYKEHWLIGVGPGNVNFYMPNTGDSVHHFWIELMANYGLFIIIGFVLFYVSSIYILISKGLKINVKMISPVLLMMIIFIPISTTPSSVFQFRILWVLIGLVLTVSVLVNKVNVIDLNK